MNATFETDFDVRHTQLTDGTHFYTVPGPNTVRDRLIPLLESERDADVHDTSGQMILGQRFGQVPARSTLYRWRQNGFPVRRNGPRIQLPTVTLKKRVYTSVEALHRMLKLAEVIEGDIATHQSLDKWNRRQQDRYKGRRPFKKGL